MSALRRWLACATCVVLAACAGAPPPRVLPGSVRPIELRKDRGPSLEVLAERTVELDAAVDASAAEDEGELSSLWSRYRLPGDPPDVDFDAWLVVAFTEGGFCNDGRLVGISLTSGGDLVPEVARSGMICNLLGGSCPTLRVYVAALPREYFPPGSYEVRLGFSASHPLAIQDGPSDLRRPAPLPALLPAPPSEGDWSKAHSRRARVVFEDSSSEFGVFVRDDAVWLPNAYPRADDEVLAAPKLLCNAAACTRVAARSSCLAPECPGAGDLLFGERPLRALARWPSDARAWQNLMGELRNDPVLVNVVDEAGPAVFPAPRETPRPVGWAAHPHQMSFETSIAGELGRETGTNSNFAGAELRLGVRRTYPKHGSPLQWTIREGVSGDTTGLDLRLRLSRELDTSDPRTIVGGGVAFALENALGEVNTESRVRTATILGVLLPEVGFRYPSGGPVSFTTSHGLPLYVLLTPELSLEARPAFTLVFDEPRTQGPEAVFSISLGLGWRFPYSKCP